MSGKPIIAAGLACPPGWLRIKSAAKYADVSATTIREWNYRGLKRAKIKGIVNEVLKGL